MTEQPAAARRCHYGRAPRVVVIGGGFGGLNAVRELADADAT
jgi:cation diffusion facilitator CzcD-associated flavoprotein CzcO